MCSVVRHRASYAYLLGIYLGDGHIAGWRKGLWQLRLFCDAAYPGIVDEIVSAIHLTRGRHSAVYRFMKDASRCVVVQNLWKHWPAYFPQHGPGPKHMREMALAEWQRAATHAEPRAFLRGLIHSDGCRYVARQRRGGKIYTYVRYSFSNRSEDIKDLFREHLELVGIHSVTPNAQHVDINRRADVAALDEFVGPKR